MGTGAKFANVACMGEQCGLRRVKASPVGFGPSGQQYAEPLRRQRIAVLHAAVSDVPLLRAGHPRNLPRHLPGRDIALANLQQRVLSVPRRFETEQLVYLEILRARA